MSNIDVFDITVTQLEHFSNVAYEDLSDLDCLNKYMVVETWSWFGQQPSSMMVSCDPVADKEQALRYADGLYTNDLMANRMGISRSGNHYEVWHIVKDPTPTSLPYAEYHGTGEDIAEYLDLIESEPVDWFGEMGDTLGEYPDEYTRAIAEMF